MESFNPNQIIPQNQTMIKYSVNYKGHNKVNVAVVAQGWEFKQATIHQFLEDVKRGYSVSGARFINGDRKKSNVENCHLLMIDIDSGLTIEEAKTNDFIKQNAIALYTSCSHTEDHHKFRLIFNLPEPLTVSDYEYLYTYLLDNYFRQADKACKDASRLFFGNTNAETFIFDENNLLSVDLIEMVREAREILEDQEIARQEKDIKRESIDFSRFDDDTDKLIQEALSYIPPRQPNSGNYRECTLVAMAIASHYTESEAIRIIEFWSPSIPGNTWQVPKKVRSYKRNGIGLGTLFHFAKGHGFKFPDNDEVSRRLFNKIKPSIIKLYQSLSEKELNIELDALRKSYFEQYGNNRIWREGIEDIAQSLTEKPVYGASKEYLDSREMNGSSNDSRKTATATMTIEEALKQVELILLDGSLTEAETLIKLDSIRERAKISDYSFERKYLPTIKRKVLKERYKLDLLLLNQIDDLIDRNTAISQLCSKYQRDRKTVEQEMRYINQQTKEPEKTFFTLDEFLDQDFGALEYLVPGMLPRGEAVILTALPKTGKTLLAIDLAFAVATGESEFLGEKTKQGKVLLVSTDESPRSTRAKLLKRGIRKDDLNNLAVMTSLSIDRLSDLEAKLENFRPDLVIIDSLKRITVGREISENSAEFADAIYQLKELVSKYNASCVLIHHSNKNLEQFGVGKLRGTTAIAGAVWGTWNLEHNLKQSKQNSKKLVFDPEDLSRKLEVISRDCESQSLYINLDCSNNSWHKFNENTEDEINRKTQEDVILTLLETYHPKGLTGREILELGNLPKSAYTALNRLCDRKVISERDSLTDKRMRVYCLPEKYTTDNQHTTNDSHTPPPSHSNTQKNDDQSKTIDITVLENSHQNSHHGEKISHQDVCTTLDSMTTETNIEPDFKISHHGDNFEGGGCVRDENILQSTGEAIATERISVVNESEAIATEPTPTSPKQTKSPEYDFQPGDNVIFKSIPNSNTFVIDFIDGAAAICHRKDDPRIHNQKLALSTIKKV